MGISYNVAIGAMKLVAETGHIGQLDSLGISKADYDRFTGSAPWLVSDRARMTSILHSLIFATVDSQGLPRFDICAEYIAACISVFVGGTNVQAACTYACTIPTGEAESMGQAAKIEAVRPGQIHALVVQLYDTNDRSAARQLFEKKVGMNIDKAKLGLT